jgi:hypothetical protein
MPVAPTLSRIQDLARRLDNSESNVDFDALGPEIAAMEREIRREIDVDKLEVQKERHNQGVFARVFVAPPAQKQLASAEEAAWKLHELKQKFTDDKMRVHARAFIRVASKVQRDVTGSWEDKALAASARWLNGHTGDAAIAAANASMAAGLDTDVSFAAQLAKKPASSLDASATGAGLVHAAALYSGRADVDDVTSALAATGKLPASKNARDLLVAAAVLSSSSPSTSAAILSAMSGALPGMWDGPEPILAAALLRGADPAAALAFARRCVTALSGAEGASTIAAAALLAGATDVDAVVKTARAIESAVAGTPAARASIAAAGILTHRDESEVIAFAKHVQSQLAGSWESEATIIAAGLLASPSTPASDDVKRAFLLRGLVRPADEE